MSYSFQVDIDYEIAFGGGTLLNKWEKYFPSIIEYLKKDGHIKDKATRLLLDSLSDAGDESKLINF